MGLAGCFRATNIIAAPQLLRWVRDVALMLQILSLLRSFLAGGVFRDTKVCGALHLWFCGVDSSSDINITDATQLFGWRGVLVLQLLEVLYTFGFV